MRGPGGLPFALCPTSHPPTPQAAFAHLALAFRCDVFTLRQRVQVEKRARDAAEENIQEELGQCRAALEVCGDQGRGLASAGHFQAWRGLNNSRSWLQQLHLSPSTEAGPILHRRGLQGDAGAAAVQPGCAGSRRRAGNQCCGEAGGRTSGLCIVWGSLPGPEGMEGAVPGLGDPSLALLGFVPPPRGAGIDLMFAFTGLQGICLPLGRGRGCICTPRAEALWDAW